MVPVAQALGSTSQINNCEETVLQLERTSPKGSGYCTTAAIASDNPGYDLDTAPPLKHVILAVGGAC